MSIADVFKMAGVGIVGAVLAVMLRKERPDLALLVSVATGLILFVWLLVEIRPVMRALEEIAGSMEGSADFFSVALKVTGIALIAQFAAQVCKDAGEEAIAQKIELGGKVIMLGMTVPLLLNMIQLILQFLPQS
jgi:stage III sporulation protein AD